MIRNDIYKQALANRCQSTHSPLTKEDVLDMAENLSRQYGLEAKALYASMYGFLNRSADYATAILNGNRAWMPRKQIEAFATMDALYTYVLTLAGQPIKKHDFLKCIVEVGCNSPKLERQLEKLRSDAQFPYIIGFYPIGRDIAYFSKDTGLKHELSVSKRQFDYIGLSSYSNPQFFKWPLPPDNDAFVITM